MTQFLIKNKRGIIICCAVLFFLIDTSSASSGKISDVSIIPDIPLFGKILYVLDGDSIIVTENNRTLHVRLWGIDAPEHDQPAGYESKIFLKRLAGKKSIILTPKDIDRYGRVVAVVRDQKRIFNEELVRNGYAWVHTYYCKNGPCENWKKLEKEASHRKIGLWKKSNPVPPWVWKTKK